MSELIVVQTQTDPVVVQSQPASPVVATDPVEAVVVIDNEPAVSVQGPVPAGAKGDTGDPGNSNSAQADENVLAGQVVYVTGTGTLLLAQADTRPDTEAAGLVVGDTLATFAAVYMTQGVFEQSDWSMVIGTASLSPGVRYFLDAATPGRLVTAQQAAPNFHVYVGKALSTTKLDIDIDPPIQLV